MPKMTVSGTKNVQFVCIEDDNSIVIDEDENLPHDLNLKCAASETQTDLSNIQIDKSTQKPAVKQLQKTVKISRIEKKAKCLEMLEKDYAVNVIQYKLDFQNYCKSNPLYIKTENVQPWTLMGKISDDILDETLLAVAREIELNDVVSQIYQEELQL